MAAQSAQSLFELAGCLSCLGPVDNAQTMRLGLLLNILSELEVETMTPQELMTEASCYACLPGVSQGDAIELALLDQISQNISGGGGGTIQVYESRDPAPPDDPTKPAISFPTGGGTITQWPANGPAWV